jgi:hypothetical protein
MGSRTVDRIVGIALGIALGVAIVVVFVFFGSEGTIDSARLNSGNGGAQPTRTAPQAPPADRPVR